MKIFSNSRIKIPKLVNLFKKVSLTVPYKEKVSQKIKLFIVCVNALDLNNGCTSLYGTVYQK